jgi:signal transduction histidine kinase
MERGNEQMQVLQAITDHALQNLSLDDLFRSMLRRIRGIMNADNIAVLLFTEDRSSLIVRAVDGIEEAVAPDICIPLGSGFAGTIAARCQPLIAGKQMAIEILTPVLREQLYALLGVPLLVNERVIGVIHIGTRHVRTYTQEDITLLERVADRLALTIERTLLAEQAEQAQQENNMYLQQLEQMNDTLQRFVSIVGHEFRTALTGILGFSALLKEPQSHLEAITDYATIIATDAQRLLRLVIDLLDLDRMQQGKMDITLQFQRIDLAELLREQIAQVVLTATSHSFSLFLTPPLSQIEGDADKLKQIVANLLSNAIKYSPKGGEVQLYAFQEGEYIHLSIRDQGVGIPEEALTKIFEPYNRIQTDATRYIGGTGLGLPITKYLIELHGGSIWVESLLDQGSTFHITLPVSQASHHHREKSDIVFSSYSLVNRNHPASSE